VQQAKPDRTMRGDAVLRVARLGDNKFALSRHLPAAVRICIAGQLPPRLCPILVGTRLRDARSNRIAAPYYLNGGQTITQNAATNQPMDDRRFGLGRFVPRIISAALETVVWWELKWAP
jgi:hypothetical protein